MAIDLLRLDQRLDVVQVTADLDATAPVGVLARLDDPQRCAILWILLEDLIVARIVKSLYELLEFPITFAFLDVICQRNHVKWILTQRFIVDLHIVVDGLLVAEVEVVLLMIGGDHVVTGVILLLLLLFVVVVMLAFASI